MIAIAAYVLGALFVGWLGRRKAIGFLGFMVLALTLTPPVAFLILMIAGERRTSRQQLRNSQ